MIITLKKILSYVPTPLPVGMTEFNAWADSIIELSGEFADKDSMRYAIASNVMHLPHTAAYKPKNFFVCALRKAAANQVASQVFQDIKTAQAERQAAEAALAAETSEKNVEEAPGL
jgi:hypothetical protein